MFITFEGLDFCGKTTQVKLLEEYLKSRKKKTVLIREPGGTVISEKVREILLDKKNSEMYGETELLLFSSSRSQLVRQVIIPALKKGIFVISDRFHDSSTAYQSFGRSISLQFLQKLNKFVIDGAVPDITFFLDIPVKEVVRRKSKVKNINLDRIEVSENNFYTRVRNGYLYLLKSEKRFRKINGMLSIDKVHRKIINEIEKFEKS